MLATLICSFCYDEIEVEVTQNEIDKWETGKYLIQECFPKMRPEHREMLISGMCPKCWQKNFSFFDNEVDYDDEEC